MRALLSVFDKTGVVELAKGLHELGWELISSGGTARAIGEAGVPVVDVADMLAGFDRLTTLAEGDPRRVVPGHDPLARRLFAAPEGGPDWLRRLDPGPTRDPLDALRGR